jgi:hypothetical protein
MEGPSALAAPTISPPRSQRRALISSIIRHPLDHRPPAAAVVDASVASNAEISGAARQRRPCSTGRRDGSHQVSCWVEVAAALRRRTADGELRTEAAGGKSGNPRRCGAPRRHPARRRRGAGRDRSSARARHRTQGAGLRLSHPPRTRGLLVVDGRSASCSTCAIAQNRRWRRGQVSKRTPSTIITTTRRVEPSSERRTVVTSVVRRRCAPRHAPLPARRRCGGPCTPGGSGQRSCPLLLRLPPTGRRRARLRG